MTSSTAAAKLATLRSLAVGALDTGAARHVQFSSLLRNNYTVLWSGWQGDVPLTGNSTLAGAGLLGTQLSGCDQQGWHANDGAEPRGVYP